MSKDTDAIVIGAGIVGCCTAFELAKKGCRTLNIDKLPGAGHGSTGNSCAIIRVHYSTFDGAAMAQEGVQYWKDWKNYLEVDDEGGFAVYRNVGCIVAKTERNGLLKTVSKNLTDLGIEWEDWNADKLLPRDADLQTPPFSWPVRLIDDPAFGETSAETLEGARCDRDGMPVLRVHMSNVMNTPAEVIEAEYPIRVEIQKLRRGSGGSGLHRGGDGLHREYRVLAEEMSLTSMFERRRIPPYGLRGGEPGAPFRVTVMRCSGEELDLPGKTNIVLGRGDRVILESCGGCGYGPPARR